MHALSQFYQGLSPEFQSPTFKKHVFSVPSQSVMADFLSRMPHLLHCYPFNELGAIYAEASKGVEHLKWRLHSDELRDLRVALSSDGQKGHSLSVHDCLTAYIVAVLNRNRSEPVQQVTNASSYRSIKAPFIDENIAGNLIQNVCKVPSGAIPMDMAGIATTVRAALVRCREPGYLNNWIGTASSLMLDTANAGKSFFFTPQDNAISINSNTVWVGCP
ncbi:hypothetical protein BS17DRAFT_691191 [Gyrodon lividus]|nr:hypothetical protein BS17DRAFT_691191 [Gyrodon lividus]